MTGKGGLTSAPNRRLRILLGVQLLWLALVSTLVFWWSRNILIQARKIAELETRLGLTVSDPALVQSRLHRTEWMIQGESLTFIVALVALTFGIVLFYWRDAVRTRGIQAFFASMTHELRTPLTSIRLQAESIADSLGGQPSEAKLIQRLLEDTTRLEAQVERTLELARVEGGGPLYCESLHLRQAVERCLHSLKDGWGERVRFSLGDWPEEWSVRADVGALQVILRNVVENSVRHSSREIPTVTIQADSAASGELLLSLTDDGLVGTGGSEMHRLGQLFEKGAGSQGAGVGLYLVRTLMTRMGGRTEFEVDAGFSVRLFFCQVNSDG